MVNSLSNNLNISKASVHLWLNKAEIEGSRRPETLSVEEWYRLVRNYEY
jgi:16S rRNA A1518/A1519 N6-dimethyltransferase RsmA/KsgA/DIM1 with predicted DNA glycosylase/AP lyase activity